ncbi:LOG family protein [Candidatus Entotheonella palauensis]|uniref:LOG family protein n=1 Tax=Candidatus Entotheonella palauensis TaxID=93172 RepID=UPI0015C4E65E|nr:LOG family protein [Candidatus Entotheonella palauensis]
MIRLLDSQDLMTLNALHDALAAARTAGRPILMLGGSSRAQPADVQSVIQGYFTLLEPHNPICIVGGRGEPGSVMDTLVEQCYQHHFKIYVVGVNPIFDLGGRVPSDAVFGFNNISLRCFAMTQLADLVVVFQGGVGTLQEIIVPIMHHKLDTVRPATLNGPRAVLVATDFPNPVTDFLPILCNGQFVSNQERDFVIPVTLTTVAHCLGQQLSA